MPSFDRLCYNLLRAFVYHLSYAANRAHKNFRCKNYRGYQLFSWWDLPPDRLTEAKKWGGYEALKIIVCHPQRVIYEWRKNFNHR